MEMPSYAKWNQSMPLKEQVRGLIEERDAFRYLAMTHEADCIAFATRLFLEPNGSHSPETLEVLERWLPIAKAKWEETTK